MDCKYSTMPEFLGYCQNLVIRYFRLYPEKMIHRHSHQKIRNLVTVAYILDGVSLAWVIPPNKSIVSKIY